MARDKNVEFSTTELLEALERGQRIYKGFEHGLDVARRIANLEGSERDLLKRVEEAKALCDSVERDCAEKIARAKAEALSANGQADKIITDAKAEADKIVTRSLAKASDALDKSQESMMKHAAIMQENQAVLDLLHPKIDAARAELKRIEKQIDDARAAKRALLEA